MGAGKATGEVGSAEHRVNEKSLTFGSAAQAHSPAEEPDLIEVIADSGKRGYAYRRDLNEGANLKTPEEVLAWQNSKDNEPTVIPVYESDGVTRIGAFTHFPGVATPP